MLIAADDGVPAEDLLNQALLEDTLDNGYVSCGHVEAICLESNVVRFCAFPYTIVMVGLAQRNDTLVSE